MWPTSCERAQRLIGWMRRSVILFLELRYAGDEDEDGAVVELPSSTSLNVRLFRTVRHGDGGRWRVYAGADNVTDEVILPQLGLPQPGRTLSLGVQFERL